MQPDKQDMARLWDMLDASKAILEFIQGRRYEDILTDRMLRSAIERNLEIVGEAAGHVSKNTRQKAPNIPWKAIVGLRNVLAHEYGEILYDRLWRICTNELPKLITRLEEIGVDDPPTEEK